MITYQLIYKHDIINYTSKQIITLKQIGVQTVDEKCMQFRNVCKCISRDSWYLANIE